MAEAASGDEVLRHACLDAALPSNDVEVVTASMEAIDCHASAPSQLGAIAGHMRRHQGLRPLTPPTATRHRAATAPSRRLNGFVGLVI